jgi:hypothetical protein
MSFTSSWCAIVVGSRYTSCPRAPPVGVPYDADGGTDTTGGRAAPRARGRCYLVFRVTVTPQPCSRVWRSLAARCTTPSPAQQLTRPQNSVQQVVADSPTRTNLVSLLQNVQAAIGRGDSAGACDKLTSFIRQVKAQSGKKIATLTATDLIADAQRIKAVLACP